MFEQAILRIVDFDVRDTQAALGVLERFRCARVDDRP